MQNSKSQYKKILGILFAGILLIQIMAIWTPNKWLNTVSGEAGDWWNSSWLYRKEITFNHSKVSSGLSNFPVLIDVTDGDLASKAQADGDDIVFTDEDCVKLSHEIELYNSTTGRLVAWVCANLSSTVDTVLYMYYGNAVVGNQENVAGVWNSNFMMVQHLGEISGTHYDSTVNDNDGSPQGGLNQNAVGKVDGADDFDGTDDYVSVPHDNTLTGYTSAMTASAWIKLDDVDTRQTILNKYETAGNQRGWAFDYIISPQKAIQLTASQDGVSYEYWYASFTPVAGTWYYVAVVWESNQIPKFYVNGQQVTTQRTGTISSIYNNTGAPFYVGRSYAGVSPERFLDGVIDEARISNVARSAACIATSYNNQHDPSTFYTIGTEETVPQAPIVSQPSPPDGSVGVLISLTELGFNLTDLQDDLMNYTVTTSPNIGSSSGTNVGDGRYTVSVSGLNYNTTYTWHVYATDGTYSTNQSFSFTTEREPAPWWDSDWLYRKEIVINHSKVNSGLSDFPVLIDIVDSDLASKAQTDGDDIVFTGDNSVKLSHEIEFYNSTNGHLVAWVCANLSSSVDTILYMYYGNVAAANQEDVAGVWDSNFMMVQHLTGGGYYALDDSTSNDNDVAGEGATPAYNATAKIAKGVDFERDDADYLYVNDADTLDGFSSAAWELWFNTESIPADRSNEWHTLLNKYNTAGNQRSWSIALWGGSLSGEQCQLRVLLSTDGVSYIANYYNWKPTLGEWYHTAITWTSGSAPTLYINGVQTAWTTSGSVTGTLLASTQRLDIGNSYTTARTWDGLLDEIRISNSARSAGWIATSYNNQYSPSTFYTVGTEETAPANRPPTHANPILVSSLGTNTTDEDLTCYNQTTSDPDDDKVTNIYHWFKDDVSLTNLQMPFDTNSSTNVEDYSGYGNNGTISGATWTSNGKVGGCYVFDGTNDYIIISDASSLDGDGTWTEMTVEHWIYLNADQTGRRTIGKMSTSADAKRSYQIGFQGTTPANRLYGAVVIGSNSYQEAAYATPLVSGVWYHVALTYKSGDGVRLYLNGVLVASVTGLTGNIQASPDKPLYIGCRFDGGYFNGKIDEVKLYPKALSTQQINQNYLESKDGFSNNSTIVSQETTVGEVWKCDVTPNDGIQDGETKTSNTLTIISPPKPYDDVVFDSSFEMGNLINVQFQDGNASGYRYYTAEVNYSTASFPDKHWWFYFSMQNTTGKTVKIELKNLASVDFTDGRWTSCEPVYSYNDVDWLRVPDGNYSCGSSTTRNFNITLSPSEDKVWLAPIPPYTVTMRDQLFASYASSLYLDITSLGITPLGQNLTVAIITDLSVPDDDKFVVYIIAHQHSCETVSSFVAEGMIKFLLNESDATAAAIRRSYIFKIVPIVNVEGVYYGISRYTPFRAGTQYDMNRAWDDSLATMLATCPEVRWIFDDINATKPDAFIDLHSDVQSLDCFFLHDGLYDTTMVNFLNNVSRGYDGTRDYWPETGSRGSGASATAPPNVRTRLGIHPSTMMEHPHDDRTNTTTHPTDHNPQTIDDWKDWGKRAILGMFEYFGEAGKPNLIVNSVVIDNQGCTIYANDTYVNGTAYYIPIKVTVKNAGNYPAGQFNVSLEIYWTTGSQRESLVKLTISSLGVEENVTLTFYWRPTHTRYYNLTATVDCDNDVVEENEADNILSLPDIPVTVMGDINGDGVVNILDAVIISLAWGATPSDPQWNILADINHDGVIDVLDGVRIGLHWGEEW